MRDEALKVQMFRFIDVLPMLKTGEQVAQIQEYFLITRICFLSPSNGA